jgi:DNA-binding transcriptional ArsR family regulator
VSLDQTLRALADPARRALVDLLLRGPRRAGEIATSLGLAPPAVSRHLRVLRRARLVQEGGIEEDARVRVYELQKAPFTRLRGWLDGVESYWGDQLQAFKAHAERKGRA